MDPVTEDLVGRLWNLCNVLKDDGVTYHQYVTELTYLLFLKLARETETEDLIPPGHRWSDLLSNPKPDQLEAYQLTLIHLGNHGSGLVRAIYAHATTYIKKPENFATLVAQIDRFDWYSARREGLGDLYEGLLDKNAADKRFGAGQYFTPRPLIDSIVRLMQPAVGDVVQDPAAGTAGFLVAASRYMREHTPRETWTKEAEHQFAEGTFYGMEHVLDTHRFALMNLFLHGLDPGVGHAGVRYGDTLSPEGAALPKASLIMTNPPFGTKKGGGLPSRSDLPVPTSNKQLCFLQHILEGLQTHGRAAVVVPDNVLFEGNAGARVRRLLLDSSNLHTILKLPTGIFYAPGVKTNVLFLNRGNGQDDKTHAVWVYDLRTNMPRFGRRRGLTADDFSEFEAAFGKDPAGGPTLYPSALTPGRTAGSGDSRESRSRTSVIAWI